MMGVKNVCWSTLFWKRFGNKRIKVNGEEKTLIQIIGYSIKKVIRNKIKKNEYIYVYI